MPSASGGPGRGAWQEGLVEGLARRMGKEDWVDGGPTVLGVQKWHMNQND